jgi:rhodanese-related sulfurtransferase
MPEERLEATENIDELLAGARSQLDRLSPAEALEEANGGAVIVDIRSESQRADDGLVPAAVYIPRNVLEWRLDPASDYRVPELAQQDRRVILICHEGYMSSLAAATVRRFGLDATDVVGGVEAWRKAGLPLEPVVAPPYRKPVQ